MSRSGFLRRWELIGRVRGSWISLDKNDGTEVLGDVREHEFTLGASWGIAVDAIRLCQLGRNGIGGSLMPLRPSELTGRLVGLVEVIGQDCPSPKPGNHRNRA
jgi:hypothetical protein